MKKTICAVISYAVTIKDRVEPIDCLLDWSQKLFDNVFLFVELTTLRTLVNFEFLAG